jgi:hypothetical protein
MLKNRDPKCMAFLDTVSGMPYTEQLVQQVENFDFKPALITILELKERLRRE